MLLFLQGRAEFENQIPLRQAMQQFELGQHWPGFELEVQFVAFRDRLGVGQTHGERVAVYANINKAIGDNPVLGFGYGTFADSFRLYDQNEGPVHYDRAHNTWLENLFELGIPAALMLFAVIGGLALTCIRGVRKRHRDWAYPALGAAASLLAGVHALFDFSLQIPAIAILFACILGIGCAQSSSSRG